nr:MAG TPA: hypothetical protein [Caudoviricetes sp.]
MCISTVFISSEKQRFKPVTSDSRIKRRTSQHFCYSWLVLHIFPLVILSREGFNKENNKSLNTLGGIFMLDTKLKKVSANLLVPSRSLSAERL